MMLVACPMESPKEKVAIPVISYSEGVIENGGLKFISDYQEVSITCETGGATIYYTTDGTTPTKDSLILGENETILMGPGKIQAFAAKSGYVDSDITSATFAEIEFTLPGGGTLSFAERPWTRFLGGPGEDYVNDMVIDSQGNLYLTGRTASNLGGQTIQGQSDVFVAKYSSTGNLQWVKLRGGIKYEDGLALAVDTSGNVYVTGYTNNSFDNNPFQGAYDLFLMKFTGEGTHQWTKFYGGSGTEAGRALALQGNQWVYVGGQAPSESGGTHSHLLLQYRPDGSLYGGYTTGNVGPMDQIQGIALSAQDLYALRQSEGTLSIRRCPLDNINNQLYTIQLNYFYGSGIAVDASNNVYIVGYTTQALDDQTAKGGRDIFIIKYSSSLVSKWSRIVGGPQDDYGTKITLAGDYLYVAGYTKSSFNGQTPTGDFDSFVMKYDLNGNHIWTKFIGSESTEGGFGVGVDTSGNVYLAGNTIGSFDGQTNKGNYDIFLRKHVP